MADISCNQVGMKQSCIEKANMLIDTALACQKTNDALNIENMFLKFEKRIEKMIDDAFDKSKRNVTWIIGIISFIFLAVTFFMNKI